VRIVSPRKRKHGLDRKLATGVHPHYGPRGIPSPPSLAFAFFGTLTDVSIAALFIAGIIPGLLTILVFSLVVWFTCLRRPEAGPLGPKFGWPERLASTRAILPIAAIFVLVIGTLYR